MTPTIVYSRSRDFDESPSNSTFLKLLNDFRKFEISIKSVDRNGNPLPEHLNSFSIEEKYLHLYCELKSIEYHFGLIYPILSLCNQFKQDGSNLYGIAVNLKLNVSVLDTTVPSGVINSDESITWRDWLHEACYFDENQPVHLGGYVGEEVYVSFASYGEFSIDQLLALYEFAKDNENVQLLSDKQFQNRKKKTVKTH